MKPDSGREHGRKDWYFLVLERYEEILRELVAS